MATAGLIFELIGRDRASGSFLKVAGAADKTAASTARAEKSLLGFSRSAVVGGAKLAGLFGAFEIAKKAIDIGKEASAFQRQMLLIQTNAGASAAEVKKMSSAVLAMAGPLATAPNELAKALYHVEQNGLRGQDALNALRVGAEGAKVGMADVEDTTNTMTIAMASGIKGVSNLQQAMGFMIATVGTGDMRLKDLNEALSGGILAVAKGFGASLRDVAAVLATLGDNGIRGADAATAVRQSLMGFAAPAKGGADALRSVGLSMTDLRDAMQKHGLVYAMNDLEKHMTSAGVTGSKVGGFITQAFGRKAGAGIAVLMGEIDRLNTKYGEAQKGALNFGDRWAATQKTTSFAFGRLNAELSSFGIGVAQKLLPPITQFATQVGVFLPKAFSTAGAIIGPFAHDVGGVLATAWHAAGAAFSFAGDALKPVVDLLSAIKGPLGIIATAALGAWVAFKLFAGIPGLLETAALKLLYMKDAVVGMGTAAQATGVKAVASMRAIGVSSAAASDEIVLSGTAARVGWAGLLGPLAAVGVGIGLLVTMFHKSGDASKAAADAAKAYGDALNTGGGRAPFLATISDQLAKSGVPEILSGMAIDAKGASDSLDIAALSGGKFVKAIADGGKPLQVLREHLQNIVKLGNNGVLKDGISPLVAADAVSASKLLGIIDTQITGITDAQTKEIAQFKALGTTAAPIGVLADKMHLTADEVTRYAGVLGLAVTKSGDLIDATKANQTAILGVSNAYDTASQAGSAYLSAVESFSKSSGTSADRAALIGSTLVAANGDALGFASAMNGAAVATHSFFKDVRANAKSAKESVGGYLASLINLKTGTINYSKAGAAPLIQDLQGIQSAAMAAAQATYQHARSTESGKRAADDAYKVYRAQTRGALMDEATQLGLTSKQAKTLADKYFGMPKKVKTLIEAAGANPVVDVLNRIGKLLANLTGQQWDINVATHYTQTGAPPRNLGSSGGSGSSRPVTAAAGGHIRGPGTGTSDSIPAWLSNGEYVVNAKQTAKHRGLLENINRGVAGFAAGGPVGNAQRIAGALRSAFGLTRNQIAGVLGNLFVESRFNPKAYNAHENAHGFAQWEGSRWTALQQYARGLGVAATSTKAEIGFLVRELRGSGVAAHIKGMKDPAKVAAYVDAHYERSSGSTRQARMDAARSLARNGLGSIPSPVGSGGGGVGGISHVGKDWIFNGVRYASERAALNAQHRAEKKSSAVIPARLQKLIGAIGQQSSPPFDINQQGFKSIAAQIARAQRALLSWHAPLEKTRKYEQQLIRLSTTLQHQLQNLRIKIRGSDLKAISRAVGGTADDIRGAFATVITDLKNAGASAASLRRVQAREAKVLTANNRYTAARDYTSNIRGALAGGFDPTGFGSMTDLIAGYQGQTGQNKAYANELTVLRKRAGKNKQALGLINTLAASGQTNSLEALFQGSASDLGNAAKAYQGYNASLNAGADAATQAKFGGKTAAQLHDDVEKQVQTTDKLIRAVTHLTTAVGLSHKHAHHQTQAQIDHALAELQTIAHHGRN